MSKQVIEKSESRRVLIGSGGLIVTSRKRVASASRIVVKVGTNVLMRDDGSVSIAVLYGIAESIANLRRSGREVLLVSSGAVGMGVQRLALTSRPARVDLTQACAAVGQSRLMTLYDDAFEKLGYRVAQVLLTEDDFLSKQRNENLRATLFTLLRLGVVPIINENDTVSTAELDRPSKARARAKVFGDNDKLSAMVLAHIKGDLLILLSDVDGLYTGDPRTTGAVLVPELSAVTDLVRSYARGGNGRGRGGMETKLEAARIANHAHRPAVIANGRTPGILEKVCSGETVGTLFFPREAIVSQSILDLALAAKSASRTIASASAEQRNAALEAVAQGIANSSAAILAANAEDMSDAQAALSSGELSKALVDRLKLSPAKLDSMIAGVRAVASLPDPVGRVLDRIRLDNGLELEKVSCPLGLLAVIFEARPEAVTQISSLAIKSANAVILKPGREVERTARVLVEAIRGALREHTSLPEDIVTNIQQRAEVDELLQLDELVDLVIPRGSYALVRHVQSATRIPVLGHSEGVCHIYIDKAANFDMALSIINDAKTDYPAACNAVETVLVHQDIADKFLPQLAVRMKERGVALRACDVTARALQDGGKVIEPVDDWHTEYGDLILAVKVVADLPEAIAHIGRYGSAHTDAIVTDDDATAQTFLAQVDSAGVYHNASTRFADGYRYGFGAEVGISTSKLHARGPVGLDGLTTYKYILRGSGQVAGDYQGPNARPFLHARNT